MRPLAQVGMILGGGALVTLAIARTSNAERPVAVYSTTFVGRLSAQAHNAKLAARHLDGLVIAPGETLSFNKVVGSWSRDQGYKRAPVSFSGTLVDTWGGGVCQTSTTLYNAALLAGMEVVERHHHQFAASYVPPGRDAAVAFPNLDLKVRNPYRFPLRVFAGADPQKLTIEVRSQHTVPLVRVFQRVSQLRPAGRLTLGTGPIGRVRNPGKPGYQVQVYRQTGSEVELLSVDSYPAMSRVVEYRAGAQ